MVFFTGIDFSFTGAIFGKFSRANFNFYGYFLEDFWTISRPLFQIFPFLFTGMIFIFTGKKTLERGLTYGCFFTGL